MKRSMSVLLTLLFLATIAGAGYWGMRSARGDDTPDIQVPATVEVTRGDVQTTVTAPGRLVYAWETHLSMAVGGTVAGVYVHPGGFVSAGTVLVQMETGPLEAEVAAAQTEVDTAQVLLEQARGEPSAAAKSAAEVALASAEVDLVALAAGPSAAELIAAEAELSSARVGLETVQTLPDPIALAQAQTLFDQATVTLHYAQSAYDTVRDRADVGMLPQTIALQQATLDFDVAKARLAAAQQGASPSALAAAEARFRAAGARLAELKAGPSAETLALAELQIVAAETRLAQLEAAPNPGEVKRAAVVLRAAELALSRARTNLQAATLTAPHDGVILEVGASAGERVAPGTGLIRLADATKLEVETSVIEEDLPLVQTGQRVDLFFDARADAEVQGSVFRIIPERLPGDRPLYPVYISATDLPAGLLSGMTVDASIIVDSREDVLRLPRTLVRARSDGTATIQVWAGGKIEERMVQTGLRGDVYVEILDGAGEGEQVVAP